MSSLSNLSVSALFDALRNEQRPLDVGFLFDVQADGESIGGFQSVENLSRQVQVHEYWEGGKNDAPHVLMGPTKHGEVTLKWGQMNLNSLYAWCDAVQLGGDFRKDVLILQLTRDGTPLRGYLLEGAFPIEWKGAGLDAGQSVVPIEEVKLAHQGITLEVYDG